jgi:hypothetical protein
VRVTVPPFTFTPVKGCEVIWSAAKLAAAPVTSTISIITETTADLIPFELKE